MEENTDEIEEIKRYAASQFVKGDEAAVTLLEELDKCRDLNITFHQLSSFPGLYCPLVFDGWLCWNATPAGSRIENPCPGFITGFDPKKTAFKDCGPNGTWFVHPDTGKPWSNYSTCIDFADLEWRKTINWVYMSGYSLSLIALLLSIFILTYFRALHCTRNILHINLFASFSINNLLWLIWYLTVVPFPDVITENGMWCQSIFVVTHYFMLTNYFWMLCEGFYLHSLLAFAFINEEQLLKYVYVIGWTIPLFMITGYATLRIVNGDNRDCWIHESAYSHVLVIPVVISLCINLVFLVSILRVLLLKIKTNTSQGQNRNELIKVFRAAFVLVPLLGLHYMIVLFRPENGPFWERLHEIFSAVSASYQGLCVACLFCFLNNEVHVQIKRRWYQFRDIPSNQVFSTVTGSTYALERRATRTSTTAIPPHVNEVSPMLSCDQNDSSYSNDSTINHNGKTNPSVNGIKNMVVRNKKSVSLVTNDNYKTMNFSPNDDEITMQPLKKSLLSSDENLYRKNGSQIAEDYV